MDTQLAVSIISNPSPLLLEDIVMSADSLADVALRHSLAPETLQFAYDHPMFQSKLLAIKAQREKTGEFDRALTRHRYREALDNAHFKALDSRTSPKDAIAYAEMLANIGGIKQGTQMVETAGAGFVFNIHFDNEVKTVEGTREQPAIEGTSTVAPDELPVVNVSSEFEFVE